MASQSFDQPFYQSSYPTEQSAPGGPPGASPPPDYSNFAPPSGQQGPYYAQSQDPYGVPPQAPASFAGSIMQPEQPGGAVGSTGFEDEPPLLEGLCKLGLFLIDHVFRGNERGFNY